MSRAFLQQQGADFEFRVQAGLVPGHTWLRGLGEREGMGTTATGEDIWRGSATTIPTPAAAGEQLEIVSDDDEDGDVGLTGALTVRVHYLKEDGSEAYEDKTLAGQTPVALTYANVRFVQDIYATSTGSNDVAVGNITIYKQGSAATIYNLIAAGGNKSMVPHRMVPLGKKLALRGWQCSEAQGKRVAFRIRSTDMYSVLLPGVFCFKDVCYIKQGESGHLPLRTPLIPALSIVKVSGWPDQASGEGSCSWYGILIDD